MKAWRSQEVEWGELDFPYSGCLAPRLREQMAIDQLKTENEISRPISLKWHELKAFTGVVNKTTCRDFSS